MPATLLFALWPVLDGQPHPDAADPRGEPAGRRSQRSAADCLTDDADLGPHLTVTATADGETCRLVFSGDASAALRKYAAHVALAFGHPPFEGTAVEQARDAFAVAVEETADELAREACYQWCEPDPDTSRSVRRMPEATRARIASGAPLEAARIEAAHLDAHLCAALGVTAEPALALVPAPRRLAA